MLDDPAVGLDVLCVGVVCVPPEPEPEVVRVLDATVDCTPVCVVDAAVPGGSGLRVTPIYEHVNTWISRIANKYYT